ncbi:hypothetical protein HY625_03065 [Candidatus Uhrbacteria bacterium]|nr:hypothetical protein [Candidatus Uhrbacteria bacterium]
MQTIPSIFTTPEEQIRRLLDINEDVWKDRSVTEEAIRALGGPPTCPPSDDRHLFCVTLLCETGDPVRTFEENYKALVLVHERRVWKWDGIVFTPEGVRLRAGAIPRPKGLRWAIAELGRQCQNQKVVDVRLALDHAEVMGIGQELSAFGAMHPLWATAMDGDTIPFVDAPDMEVRAFAHLGYSFKSAPCLLFNRSIGEVELGFSEVGVESHVSHFGPGYFQYGLSVT